MMLRTLMFASSLILLANQSHADDKDKITRRVEAAIGGP
jgi:hypothetical protein